MKIILGIGNPGEKYSKHYHNLGIIFAQYLVNVYKNELISKTTSNNAETYKYENFSIIISKVFMNNSIKALSGIYNIDKMLVAHDELMIAKYRIRIKTTQGNAGHNGLRSISIVHKAYDRLQIGVDHPKNFSINTDVSDYVLSNINNIEEYYIKFEESLPLIQKWLSE